MVFGPDELGNLGGIPMHRHELTNDEWKRIESLLPGRRGEHGGVGRDNRLFVNAIYYIAKTGIPWRDLPERFGKWDTVYQRFKRWCAKGVWEKILKEIQDPDLEWLMLDSTVIRAHQHAAGLNTAENDEALGRSRGGFSTKIHVAVDALGNPVTIHLSPGQDADISHAETVLGDLQPDHVLGDKGYDSNAFVETVESRGATAVIPPKANRKEKREYDNDVYKERNKVERCINLFKQFRRVATRYEKRAKNFLGFVVFAAITIWLR
jgi:transposase